MFSGVSLWMHDAMIRYEGAIRKHGITNASICQCCWAKTGTYSCTPCQSQSMGDMMNVYISTIMKIA